MNRFSLICFLIVVAAVAPLFHPLARESVQDREQNVRQRQSPGALNGKRIALVIGNGKYTEAALLNPPNDAAGIARALRDLGFDVIELTDQNKTQIKQALRAFGDKLDSDEGNVALFYFAGHGSQVNGRNYLIPIGADVTNEAEAEDECVNLELVLAQIKRSRKGLNIIVLDACRNNPFRGWRSTEGGLAYVNAPRGTLIAYATAPGRTAADGRGRNSPYTAALLNQIRKPNINLLKMFENVRAEVEMSTNGAQTPWESTSVTNGSEFYLAGNAAEPLRPFDPRQIELEYWNSIKNSYNPADFRGYLAKYPNGEFKTIAKNRIAELDRDNRPPSPFRSFSFDMVTVDGAGKIVNRIRREGEQFIEDMGNGVTLEMVRIPSGKFTMGSPANESGREDDEGPQHDVSISEFLLGRYEVTQRQWQVVATLPKVEIELNTNPSRFKGDYLPVEQISWHEAKEFIARLNKHLRLNGRLGYRLPSEAEWEYAARAGTMTSFSFGPTISPDVVNYGGIYPYSGKGGKGIYRGKTIAVGELGVANSWGLFDMHGNVAEWCEDNWPNNYDGAPTDSRARLMDLPESTAGTTFRVNRGGDWFTYAKDCRSANRRLDAPDLRIDFDGFRLARTYR